MFRVPENCRIKEGKFASDERAGNNGMFFVIFKGIRWNIQASDGAGWEHVSVSSTEMTPTWEVMARIKDLFWDEEDCVVQYHPPKSTYVDFHPNCLHLWRPIDQELPRPMGYLVGPNGRPG